MAACFTPLHSTLCIALADVRLGCSCSAMEIHSASTDPALSFYMVYHLVAELLLFPIASTLLLYHWQLTGILSSEEISRLDLLHRWHPITVPCWNSLSSWEQPILLQMFAETVYMPRCLLLYTRGHGSDWTTRGSKVQNATHIFSNPTSFNIILHEKKTQEQRMGLETPAKRNKKWEGTLPLNYLSGN